MSYVSLSRLTGLPAFLLVIATCCAPAWAQEQQSATVAGSQLEIHTDFPGASARVLAVDQALRRIRVDPASPPGRGWACWN